MKRIIILEKTGDYLRQYWKLPYLDYPMEIIDQVIQQLIKYQKIIQIKYTKDCKIIPWIDCAELYGEDDKFLPAKEISFPYPRYDLKTEIDLEEYNKWLMSGFKKEVIKLNNSMYLHPGWEGINYLDISELKPIDVTIDQRDVDKIEYKISIDSLY